MDTIGLVINPLLGNAARKLAEKLLEWARLRGFGVLCSQSTASLLGCGPHAALDADLVRKANPVIVLGGDGTLMSIARHVHGDSPLFFGVNFGQVGFLTELGPDDLLPSLEEFLSGNSQWGIRYMLLSKVVRGRETCFCSQAVNDAVVQKGACDRMMHIDVRSSEHQIMRVRGDGIIFATATGSTAYSLSAGGSIVHPALEAILVTPICPHSLTNRPLVLPGDSLLSATVPDYDGEEFISVDGQASARLEPGDRVEVALSSNRFKYVRSTKRDYFETLRAKLNWGAPNQSGLP
jgi:NAD+ kinase